MKNKIIALFIILIGFAFWVLLNILLSPSWQYSMLNHEKHQRTEEFKNLPTEELILRIDGNRDWKKHKGWKGNSKYIQFEEAIKTLGSKTDEKALSKLKEIILSFPEGQKCTAIYAIGRSKNKGMVPVLCEALKRHTLQYTDDVIVKMLVNIDDPRALECFIQEKDKIKSKDSYEMVEQAIEKWSEEKTNH